MKTFPPSSKELSPQTEPLQAPCNSLSQSIRQIGQNKKLAHETFLTVHNVNQTFTVFPDTQSW